jgi:acyl-[acyl-carrier-protein]-phospholipid O-acyltransferase/long-chain-fatty-acid--[acyl-carrier-protein] ligase
MQLNPHISCAAMILSRVRRLLGDWIRLVGGALIRWGFRIQVTGMERLPAQGGVLLLPNHVTYADAFFIAAACPRRVRFVMDEAFMAHGAIRHFVGIFETVTIRREQAREAIRIIIDALQQGDVVCLFPEGQLTRTGTLCELRRGFELIAKKAGHPLLPLWCDGAWASVFAFPRGRRLREIAAQRPGGLVLAYGEPIPPYDAAPQAVRQGLMEAAAEAIGRRFSATIWGNRMPRGPSPAAARFRELAAADRRRIWVNAYQIGQVNALRPGGEFCMLAADVARDEFLALSLTFPTLFRAKLRVFEDFCEDSGRIWVGGDVLRQRIQEMSRGAEITFYQIGNLEVFEPLCLTGVRHLPCLAVGGVLVSMSMPDPPLLRQGLDLQRGNRSGAVGKLLPGWYLLPEASGAFARLHGPAAPLAGFLLPSAWVLDAEGFLRVDAGAAP